MKHLFLPYELAVIAKEKGFNEPCLGAFTNKTDMVSGYCKKAPKGFLLAPLYQQIVDWFRLNHKIDIQIITCIANNMIAYAFLIKAEGLDKRIGNVMGYYFAFNAGIEEAFKLI